MSRIGRLPVPVPSGVEITLDGQQVSVKGPKGTLQHHVKEPITVARLIDRLGEAFAPAAMASAS